MMSQSKIIPTAGRFRIDQIVDDEDETVAEKLTNKVRYDCRNVTFFLLTFILMTIASCPFHGWQSFQSFILGSRTEDDLPYTLERVYTWGSALEMVIGLLSGAALDVFGPTLTSLIGLGLFHFSCISLCPLIALREGTWSEGCRTFLLRHQRISMMPWNLILAVMFASPNFTSMGWFVLRSSIQPNRLSGLVAGTQYLSSSVSTLWWLLGEYWNNQNALLLFLSSLISISLSLTWLKEAISRERSENAIKAFAIRESFMWGSTSFSSIEDNNPKHLESSRGHSLGQQSLPPVRNLRPWKLYFYHLTNGFLQIAHYSWLSLFAYWYSTSIFLMTYYDSRFRSMLLSSIYVDRSDLPKSLIFMSSCFTIMQAPACFCLGEWISVVSSRHKTFLVAVLCLSCSLLYAFALIFLTHFPYFSVACNGIAGSFVYGSKYWFTDACISGDLIDAGKEQYGVITGTLQLVAGMAALLNLVSTVDGSGHWFTLTRSSLHSIASAVAVSGLIPGIVLIILLWTKQENERSSGFDVIHDDQIKSKQRFSTSDNHHFTSRLPKESDEWSRVLSFMPIGSQGSQHLMEANLL
eukprot:GHVH01004546.1.p1 GENE.GHVH01004546.1~~GHVH01004546.1.p1  ORF type:complete len:579 (-),score=52.32 GHVH01004546.1:24-1760(-)